MAEITPQTAMAGEIAEIPQRAEALLMNDGAIRAAAERIARLDPRFVVLCGRGSSGHVTVFMRYLFEARLGVLVSAAAPSVVTAYRRRPDMRDALFVVVSQSGRSPDLVMATQVARESGALTLAIVNDEASPAAGAADLVVPIGAGPEKAIAATKTVALSMVVGAALVAHATEDAEVLAACRRLPKRLAAALSCDWREWSESLAQAPAAFVAGRGYGFGAARELALKISETLRLPALGYSAAELRHGPRAAISPATPVLLLRQNDEAAAAVDDLAAHLRDSGDQVFIVGGPHGTLAWPGDDHPICDPIVMLLPAYAAIEAAAKLRGLDPDNPPHLQKVTRTL